jgi:hypothetical protein
MNSEQAVLPNPCLEEEEEEEEEDDDDDDDNNNNNNNTRFEVFMAMV